MKKHICTLLSVPLILLSACGGGGGSSPASNAGNPMPNTPAIQTPGTTALAVHGTVATGLALAGAQVSARCQTGQWTTRTDDAGRYQLQLEPAALPCFLKASTTVAGPTLYSAILPQTGATVANITTLTDLVLARMWGTDPAERFANATVAQIAQRLTKANADTAQRDIAEALSQIVSIDNGTSVISTDFTAATANQPGAGDAHDRLLDTLGDSLDITQLQSLRTLAGSTGGMPAIVKSTANAGTSTGPARVFFVQRPAMIDGLLDTDPWSLRSEPALGLWPLVSSFDQLRPLQFGPLQASDLPADVWPLHFQSWEWRNGLGANSGYRNDGACALSKVDDALVATVGSRTWSVRMDGAPSLSLVNGLPGTGDALGLSVNLRTVITRAIVRYIELHAQNDLPLVHPVYGPFQGGTSIALHVSYDPLDSNNGARATLLVTETLANTDPNTQQSYPFMTHQYRCIDQNYRSAGNTGTTPADSTLR